MFIEHALRVKLGRRIERSSKIMIRPRRLSNVVGFDDAPFAKAHRGNVKVVGAVFARERLDGVLVGQVRRDGANATRELVRLVAASKYTEHLQLVMLQGVALAGFNVVDVHELSRRLALPTLVVARHAPDYASIEQALLKHVADGRRKWALIEQLGPMEPAAGVFIQRIGLSQAEAQAVLTRFALNGHVPEPLRVAHLIAGAIGAGQSRGRA